MGPDGRYLAAAFYRIAHLNGSDSPNPEAVYAKVAGRLASLSGLQVRGLRVDADDTRERCTVVMEEAGGLTFPARSLSEGTLRFLSLSVLLHDPGFRGVICMEEPQNGIHPAYEPVWDSLR